MSAPRTLHEADHRGNFYVNPYLNAPNSIHPGYRCCTWADDDRRLARLIKIILIFAVTSTIILGVK